MARELGMTVKQFDESAYDHEFEYWRAVLRRRPPLWMASWKQHASLVNWLVSMLLGSKHAPDARDLMPDFEYE